MALLDKRDPPIRAVQWGQGVWMRRALPPATNPFEDIARPEDWPLLHSAVRKTSPQFMESLGLLDLIPAERRPGAGSGTLMAPFTHVSTDRPGRFSDGRYGLLSVMSDFETAVCEAGHQHSLFMAATDQPPGWSCWLRALSLPVSARLHVLRSDASASAGPLVPGEYTAGQTLAADLRREGADGLLYPSSQGPGQGAALFYPDLAGPVAPGRHLKMHWNGASVDLVRDATQGMMYRLG